MLSRLAIRRRVTTMMITMMVFLAGIVSYMNLDMNLMPEMDIPIVVVSTTYVGAGPEEIENLDISQLGIQTSEFVANQTGVLSVSTACSYLASSKGTILRDKAKYKGITIALSKERS